jgi:hypothetical protein
MDKTMDRREKLRYLQERLADLQAEHIRLRESYLAGHISLTDEVTQGTAVNEEVYRVVEEIVSITHPAAV